MKGMKVLEGVELGLKGGDRERESKVWINDMLINSLYILILVFLVKGYITLSSVMMMAL